MCNDVKPMAQLVVGFKFLKTVSLTTGSLIITTSRGKPC